MYRRVAVLLLLGACSTYASSAITEPDASTEGGGPPPGDGGADVSDAGGDDDAAPLDAGPDGLMFADDFEKGEPACSDWVVGGGTSLVTTSAAHGGARSCAFCAAGGGVYAAMGKLVAARGPGTYTLLGYARAETTLDGGYVRFSLAVTLPDAGNNVGIAVNGLPVSASSWSTLQTTGTTMSPAETITAAIDLGSPQSPICVDLDDIALFYSP